MKKKILKKKKSLKIISKINLNQAGIKFLNPISLEKNKIIFKKVLLQEESVTTPFFFIHSSHLHSRE